MSAPDGEPDVSDEIAGVHIGTITIAFSLDERGHEISLVTIEGDIPFVTYLGLLRMAEDMYTEKDEEQQ